MGRSDSYDDDFDNDIDDFYVGTQRRFGRRFLVFFLILAIVGGGAFFVWRRFLQPIDVDVATTDQAVGWLTLRDLSAESPETREKLFELYFKNIVVPETGENATDDGVDVKYELPQSVRRFSSVFLLGRDEKVAKWKTSQRRLPYLRLDYTIVPTKKRTSEYVVSDDVQPGPSLEQRWKRRQEEIKNGVGTKKLFTEKNIQLLIMHWFVAKRKEYDSAPDEQKKETLDKIVKELTLFQGFYNQIRVDGKKAPLSRAKMLGEFEMTTDSWLELESKEELAKTFWFKDLLESVATRQMGGAQHSEEKAASYPPRVPKQEKGSEEAAKPTASKELGAFWDKAQTSVRDYFFVKAE